MAKPVVSIIMGSASDLPVMEKAGEVLKELDVPFEMTVVSAHRTPERMVTHATEAAGRGIKVIVAGAGGAAGGFPPEAGKILGLFCSFPRHLRDTS